MEHALEPELGSTVIMISRMVKLGPAHTKNPQQGALFVFSLFLKAAIPIPRGGMDQVVMEPTVVFRDILVARSSPIAILFSRGDYLRFSIVIWS